MIDDIAPGQALDWGNTDTGLGFTTVMSQAAIPEPADWLLLLAGAAIVGATARVSRRLAA